MLSATADAKGTLQPEIYVTTGVLPSWVMAAGHSFESAEGTR